MSNVLDRTTPDLEPITTQDLDPNKSILSPLYGSGIHMDNLPARLIADCDGTLEDAAQHILGKRCVITDWDADLDSRLFNLYMVMPDDPKPTYLETMHLHIYGKVAEMTASRAVPLSEPGSADYVADGISLDSGHFEGASSNLEAYVELDTVLLRLTVTGLVSDLPKIDEMEEVLRRAEDRLRESGMLRDD